MCRVQSQAGLEPSLIRIICCGHKLVRHNNIEVGLSNVWPSLGNLVFLVDLEVRVRIGVVFGLGGHKHDILGHRHHRAVSGASGACQLTAHSQ